MYDRHLPALFEFENHASGPLHAFKELIIISLRVIPRILEPLF